MGRREREENPNPRRGDKKTRGRVTFRFLVFFRNKERTLLAITRKRCVCRAREMTARDIYILARLSIARNNRLSTLCNNHYL